MGGGNSQQQSAPITADQRSALYTGAMGDFASSVPSLINTTTDPTTGQSTYGLNAPQYQAPTYQDAGAPQMIDNGNLQQLQDQTLQGYTAGLDYAKGQDTSKLNTDLANRGIWSSGLADKAQTDLNAAYAPQYAQAGAAATGAADTLQNSQLQAANSYNLQNSGAQNTFNLSNAGQQNQSQWAPLNYLSGIWNGTGGISSSGDAMNFSI